MPEELELGGRPVEADEGPVPGGGDVKSVAAAQAARADLAVADLITAMRRHRHPEREAGALAP